MCSLEYDLTSAPYASPKRKQTSTNTRSNVLSSLLLPSARVQEKLQKTYDSGYSPVVTHLTTNPPVSCLNIAELTGSIVVPSALLLQRPLAG
jgi:hypothetical protein